MSMRVTLKKPAKSAISLEAAKVRLGITGTEDDALLQDLLEGATSRVESILHRPIRQGLYRETIEQEPVDDSLVLGGAPVAAPVVTAGEPVAVLAVEQDAGRLLIAPAPANTFERGFLELRSGTTTYQATYRSGWIYDEGAKSLSGALTESFTLSADAAVGAVEIAIDATGLNTGAAGLIPAGATLSFGDEIVFAVSSARLLDVLTVQISPAIVAARLAGATIEQVDERVPRAIVQEIIGLLREAYAVEKQTASAGLNVSEVSGDGYSIKMRNPKEVDEGIKTRLREWVRS